MLVGWFHKTKMLSTFILPSHLPSVAIFPITVMQNHFVAMSLSVDLYHWLTPVQSCLNTGCHIKQPLRYDSSTLKHLSSEKHYPLWKRVFLCSMHSANDAFCCFLAQSCASGHLDLSFFALLFFFLLVTASLTCLLLPLLYVFKCMSHYFTTLL